MNEHNTILILLALDDARNNGARHMTVEALSERVDGDPGLLDGLLADMSQAGWIEVEPAPCPTVTLKRDLGGISLYDVMTLKEDLQMDKFIRSVLQDISVLDMKMAEEKFDNAPRDREYAERMLADAWRRIRERERERERMRRKDNTVN